MMREVSSLTLTVGGNIVRQGEHFLLGYQPKDVEGNPVNLEGKTLSVAFVKRNQVVYETTAEFDPGDGLLYAHVDQNIGSGEMWLEFTATDPNAPTYRKKFPSSRERAIINVVPGADDIDFVGVGGTTVEQLRTEQATAQQEFEAVIVPKVESIETQQLQLSSDFQAAAGALTEDSEVILARGDKPTLGARLDETAVKLAETGERIDALADFNRYGKIKLPTDFPKILPFDLYRDHDGIIKHTLNFDNFELNAGHIHLKAYVGSEANDGLTEATPVRLLNDAITKANALPQSTVIIHLYDDAIDHSRSGAVYSHTLQKNLIFKSHAPSGRTAFFGGYRMNAQTWTQDGTAYYGNAVPYSNGIAFDGKFKDYRGIPKQMQIVGSIQQAKDTPNSVFFGATQTYIHTLDNRAPDASIMLLQEQSYAYIFNLNNKRLVMRDIHYVFRGGSNALRVNGLGTAANDVSEFYYENCVFTQSKTNGLAVVGVRGCYGFDSTAFDTDSDGFNYHALSMTDAGNEFVFEYHCEAFNCGNEGDSTMNATTAHEGITVLRVGTVGYDCYGPVCADVNGCYSVNIDCTMYDSLRPTYRTRAGFYFDESGEPLRQGTAYLINCAGGGNDTWTFNTDGNVELYVQQMKGSNIPTDIPYTVLQT